VTVVDASVALKWFVDEDGSDVARTLLGGPLTAPDLLMAEVANGLWTMARTGRLAPEAPGAALRRLPRYFDHLAPLAPLAPRAAEIAGALDHPAYDAFYLALAEAGHGEVVTADRRLAAAAARSPWRGLVRLL
jgi:predicted nucleic acid-binding protein